MTLMTEAIDERSTGLALQAILDEAPAVGVREAVRLHGGVLPEHVRAHVLELSEAELAELGAVRDALGGLDAVAMDNNNNI